MKIIRLLLAAKVYIKSVCNRNINNLLRIQSIAYEDRKAAELSCFAEDTVCFEIRSRRFNVMFIGDNLWVIVFKKIYNLFRMRELSGTGKSND